MDSHPLCTLGAGERPPAPSTPAADTSVKSRSLSHSMGRTVPRHATTTSRLPSAATPASVATATYPIQFDSRFRTMNGAGTPPAPAVA
ncbi:Os01g0652375 [Oryza sativa Japonica Group]|uniref:Os01g0652375 protein n=1 Tax=Oryza sativa subsp. japonica TaxID=39947 RepID=A0A0P0V5Z3_ORYSJ|nr:hypothetical protein EE612_004712 [Oryza sativa]BAS73462.1 Os01g0652375 [Oryza sativa Japonica Group]